MKNIGILALQGDFAKHIAMVGKAGHSASEIRTSDQLWQTDALIIPGGESSTFLKMINRSKLYTELRSYAQSRPILGTCAGLIILAKHVDNLDAELLGLIDISVARNAYGRQKESFIDEVSLSLNGSVKNITGVFIRAPKILSYGPDVNVIGLNKKDVVMAGNKNVLVCTFHPELTDDLSVHKYFIENYT